MRTRTRRAGTRTALAATMVLIVSAEGRALGAAPANEGYQLVKIEFAGLSRLSAAQATRESSLVIGQWVDRPAVAAAEERLQDSGLFKTVGARFSAYERTMRLTFSVEEAPWDVPVAFDNFVWFKDGELVAGVAREVPTFDGRAPRSGHVLAEIGAALQHQLAERHLTGRVEYGASYIEGEKSIARHVYTIKDAHIPVCSVRIAGASAVSEGELTALCGPLKNAEYSRTQTVSFASATLLPVYSRRGFLLARFEDPVVEIGSGGACPTGVFVTLPVVEGPSCVWGSVSWAGVQVFSPDELTRKLGLGGGPADRARLDSGLTTIRELYEKRGYIEAAFHPSVRVAEAERKAVVEIAVEEGAVYRMGKLSFEGVGEKEAERLRGSWRLPEGEIYDSSRAKESMEAVMRTLLAARLSGTSVDWSARRDREHHTVDVSFKLN